MSHHEHARPASRTLSLATLLGATLTLLLGLLLVLAAPGAARADDQSTSREGSQSFGTPPGKAWVRVGHFVPGMGTTSIELTAQDDSVDPISLGDAGYGEVSDYEKLAPGTYTATVRETSAESGAEPLLSRSFELTSSEARTVAVVGTADAPRLAFLADDLTPPAPGTARVRLLSASDSGPLTVRAVDGPTIADGAVLGQATPYVSVPAGSWTLELEGDSASATAQRVPIVSGSVYTVVALDSPDQGVEIQVVTDAAGAVVAPKGGAKTGGGGTAPAEQRAVAQPSGPASGGLVVASLVAAAAVALGSRRRLARASG